MSVLFMAGYPCQNLRPRNSFYAFSHRKWTALAMMKNDLETLTTPEVLLELGISRKTFYKWMGRGIIRPSNFNPLFDRQSRLLFLKSDVEAVKVLIRQPYSDSMAAS